MSKSFLQQNCSNLVKIFGILDLYLCVVIECHISSHGREAVLTSVLDEIAGGAGNARGCAMWMVLPPRERALLTEILVEVRLAKGSSVFSQGDSARHLFCLSRGVVRTSKMQADGRRQVTGFLYPGDIMGLSFEGAYNYSADALTEVLLQRVPIDNLSELFEEAPNLAKYLLEATANELAAAQDQMVLLGCKTAREKVASFLMDLSSRAGPGLGPSAEIDLVMSRADIADYLGLAIESISRALTDLKQEGLVEFSKARRVMIRDRTALERSTGRL